MEKGVVLKFKELLFFMIFSALFFLIFSVRSVSATKVNYADNLKTKLIDDFDEVASDDENDKMLKVLSKSGGDNVEKVNFENLKNKGFIEKDDNKSIVKTDNKSIEKKDNERTFDVSCGDLNLDSPGSFVKIDYEFEKEMWNQYLFSGTSAYDLDPSFRGGSRYYK